MDQLIKLLQERFNLDEATSRQIIATVADFAKERLPDQLKGMVDKALNGESPGGLGNILGSMFGK